ncbi:MAG: hypothetical protein J6Z01_15835, partial [Bacteroidales bacterium]|nr:hypothetical protein [Bacteroidales bacterium]
MHYKFIISTIIAVMICNAASGQKHTISGYITDQKSQETVIGAAVFDQNSRHGTISNTFGFYSITLNDGAVKM